jgi:hypothetical protein
MCSAPFFELDTLERVSGPSLAWKWPTKQKQNLNYYLCFLVRLLLRSGPFPSLWAEGGRERVGTPGYTWGQRVYPGGVSGWSISGATGIPGGISGDSGYIRGVSG